MLISNENERSSFLNTYNKIRQWAIERNLHLGATVDSQACKLWEEFGELAQGFNKNRPELIRDGIGDVLVVAIVMNTICEFSSEGYEDPEYFSNDWAISSLPQEALLAIPEVIMAENTEGFYYNFGWLVEVVDKFANSMGISTAACLEESYLEIKDRKGMMINGKFVKEADLAKVAA